jgi:hypothetical protein
MSVTSSLVQHAVACGCGWVAVLVHDTRHIKVLWHSAAADANVYSCSMKLHVHMCHWYVLQRSGCHKSKCAR